MILVGNKSDLGESQRQVSTAEGAEKAMENGILFIETSAKLGHNIQALFTQLAEKLPEKNGGSSIEKKENENCKYQTHFIINFNPFYQFLNCIQIAFVISIGNTQKTPQSLEQAQGGCSC